MQTVMYMKGSGMKIKLMDVGNMCMRMEQYTMVIGNMINSMATVLNTGLMVLIMMESLFWATKKDRGICSLLMVQFMRENLVKTRSMGWESINGVMASGIQANGNATE